MLFLRLTRNKKKEFLKCFWDTCSSVWTSRERARGCFDIQKATSAHSQATWCREIALSSLHPFKLWGLHLPQSISELQRRQQAQDQLSHRPPMFGGGLRWWFWISVFILGGFMHARFELFLPLFEVWTQDGETVCSKPAGAVEVSSMCYGTKCFVFPAAVKDAKITLHLGSLKLELHEYFIVSTHANVEWQEERGHASVETFRLNWEVTRIPDQSFKWQERWDLPVKGFERRTWDWHDWVYVKGLKW